MDVMKKVSLMHVYESYWNMLPPEIQDYIWKLKIAQMYIDAGREEMKKRLRREIMKYALLKETWGFGHVKCVPFKHTCGGCKRHHLKVYSYFTKTKYFYLGCNVRDALAHVDYVKSLLQ